jgi:hypothetical protein
MRALCMFARRRKNPPQSYPVCRRGGLGRAKASLRSENITLPSPLSTPHRHSGERRNPVLIRCAEHTESKKIQCPADAYFHWIPAFDGMTVRGIQGEGANHATIMTRPHACNHTQRHCKTARQRKARHKKAGRAKALPAYMLVVPSRYGTSRPPVIKFLVHLPS